MNFSLARAYPSIEQNTRFETVTSTATITEFMKYSGRSSLSSRSRKLSRVHSVGIQTGGLAVSSLVVLNADRAIHRNGADMISSPSESRT